MPANQLRAILSDCNGAKGPIIHFPMTAETVDRFALIDAIQERLERESTMAKRNDLARGDLAQFTDRLFFAIGGFICGCVFMGMIAWACGR